MKYYRETADYKPGQNPAAVTVGKFDGLHTGHMVLINNVLSKRDKGFESIVVSFDIPPRQRIEEESSKVLATNHEKACLLESLGIDVFLELEFSRELMRMPPEKFVGDLRDKLDMKYLTVGTDFKFGFRGAGNTALLDVLSVRQGFELNVEKKVRMMGRDVSSTFIREEIAMGHMDTANALLGRSYSVRGEIIRGNHIGTDELSRPTINMIAPDSKLLPPNGVYFTRVNVAGNSMPAITNIGIRPTIAELGKRVWIETHLFGFSGSIYGREAEVSFLKFLRPEIKFKSISELRAQIDSDAKKAMEYHGIIEP